MWRMVKRRPTTRAAVLYSALPEAEVTTRTMGFVTTTDIEPSPSTLTLTNEQINSVPLLLGVIEQMGIRDVIELTSRPTGPGRVPVSAPWSVSGSATSWPSATIAWWRYATGWQNAP